jgi:hypothetical protein
VRADFLQIAFSSLRAQENQDGRDQGRASPQGSPLGVRVSMMNIYCAACHISSPRYLRELLHPRPYCTVCGVPLDKSLVEAVVARFSELSTPGIENIDGEPVSMQELCAGLWEPYEE